MDDGACWKTHLNLHGEISVCAVHRKTESDDEHGEHVKHGEHEGNEFSKKLFINLFDL